MIRKILFKLLPCFLICVVLTSGLLTATAYTSQNSTVQGDVMTPYLFTAVYPGSLVAVPSVYYVYQHLSRLETLNTSGSPGLADKTNAVSNTPVTDATKDTLIVNNIGLFGYIPSNLVSTISVDVSNGFLQIDSTYGNVVDRPGGSYVSDPSWIWDYTEAAVNKSYYLPITSFTIKGATNVALSCDIFACSPNENSFVDTWTTT